MLELELDYIDLFLIHSPPSSAVERKEAWQCLEHFHETGEARSIGKGNKSNKKIDVYSGVSNYQVPHLEEIAQLDCL